MRAVYLLLGCLMLGFCSISHHLPENRADTHADDQEAIAELAKSRAEYNRHLERRAAIECLMFRMAGELRAETTPQPEFLRDGGVILLNYQEPVEGKRPKPDRRPKPRPKPDRPDDDVQPEPAPKPIPPKPRPEPDPNFNRVRPLPPHVIPVPVPNPVKPGFLMWLLTGGASLIRFALVCIAVIVVAVAVIVARRFRLFR